MRLKYILTLAGEIRAGNVGLHLELKQDGDQVIGGGRFHYDNRAKELTLYGTSVDFGSVDKSLVLKAFENNTVPLNWGGLKVKFSFDPLIIDAVDTAVPFFNYPKNTGI